MNHNRSTLSLTEQKYEAVCQLNLWFQLNMYLQEFIFFFFLRCHYHAGCLFKQAAETQTARSISPALFASESGFVSNDKYLQSPGV